MTELIPALSAIADRYDVVLCDLWGCLHNGKTAFAEAVAALRGFRERGGRVVLLTNAPRPNSAVIAQLDRLGVPQDGWDMVASSGDAAQEAILAGLVGRKVYHLGPEKDAILFTEIPPSHADAPPVERVPLAEAEGIVCTGPFDDLTETPEDYRATLLFAKAKGLPMICANPDIVVDLGDKRIYCAGAIARLFEDMGGEVHYFGKPYPPIYDLTRRRLAATGGALAGDRVLAIGDGITTDIAGGIAEGFDTLFVTGGLAAAEFGPDPDRPDPERLRRWLDDRLSSPTYAIGRLR